MEHSNCSPGMSYHGSPAMGQPQYHEMQPVPYIHQRPPSAMHPQHQLSIQTDAHFRVAEWQRPYDSGVHSLQQSQAPSVMSMPGSSRMSMVSVADTADLTDQQRQKFENIPLSFDAVQPEAASAAIPDLINLINDEDEAVAMRALSFIRCTAKRDSEAKFQKPIIHQLEAVRAIVELLGGRQEPPNLIRIALGALFDISMRPEGAHLVFRANMELNGLMVRKLIDFIKRPDNLFQNHAIALLHTLLSDSRQNENIKVACNQNIKLACDCEALEALTRRLFQETSEKLLSIVVQTINILLTKNQEQIRQFFEMQGPKHLVYILQTFQYEGLLMRTTKLLNKLTCHADDLVNLNAPFAVSRCLSHASPRLVDISLECLRNLSHVRSMQNQPEILNAVIRLFGVSKLKLIQYCMDILINMCAEGKPNKEILCRNPTTIQFLLSILQAGPEVTDDRTGKAKEDLQETVLRLLRILCLDHLYMAEVQAAVIQHWYILLQLLQTMRPSLIWRTLQLINRLVHNEQHLNVFAHAREKVPEYGFAGTVVFILKVACNNLSKGDVDGVKVVDILQASITVLNLFSRHRHLCEELVQSLLLPDMMRIEERHQANVYLPIFVLEQNYPGKDEKMLKQPALSIVAATVAYPQVAARFRNDPNYMRGLQEMCKFPDYVHTAERALRVLQEGQPYPPLRCAPAPAVAQDRRFPPQRPSSPEFPEDLATVDPFVNVFCPATTVPHNTPPFSPQPPVNHPPTQQRPPPYDSLPSMNYPDPYNAYPGPYGHGPPQYPPSQGYYPPQDPYQQPSYYGNSYPGEHRYPPG